MALVDNLIAFWELEESSGTREDAHGSNDLSDNATVTSNTGKVGTAAQFTAANGEFLSRADNADLSTGNINFTICAWVFFDDVTNQQMIASKAENASNAVEYFLDFLGDAGGDIARFIVTPDGDFNNVVQVQASTHGAMSVSTWYFITAWHDADNDQIGIAVNAGTPDTTAHAGGLTDLGAAFRMGAWHNGAPDLFMNGRIDQVGFWKRVLTSQERTDLYNGGNGLSYAQINPPPGSLKRRNWVAF